MTIRLEWAVENAANVVIHVPKLGRWQHDKQEKELGLCVAMARRNVYDTHDISKSLRFPLAARDIS